MKSHVFEAALAFAFLVSPPAEAGITQFSAQDDATSIVGPWPNSAAAASSFLAAAGAYGPVFTETFETLPVGTGAVNAPTFAIPGATVTSNTTLGPNDGFGGVNNFTPTNSGTYGFNVTPGGTNWFGFPAAGDTDQATFTFDAPIHSFGFYTTGLQSFATTSLTVSFNDGSSETLTLPVNVAGGASYFGFTDTSAFTSVTISTQQNRTDYWGIDNVSYNFAVVPELQSWAMLLIGFAGLAVAGFRTSRRTRSVARPG
jgi:hypothetical protein